jgi:hypothetical protein
MDGHYGVESWYWYPAIQLQTGLDARLLFRLCINICLNMMCRSKLYQKSIIFDITLTFWWPLQGHWEINVRFRRMDMDMDDYDSILGSLRELRSFSTFFALNFDKKLAVE